VTRAKGTLNLSGGHLRNDYQMAIGINGATGIVNQTGGAITHLTTDTNQMTYIGYGYGTNAYTGAGYGLYHLSGGTFATRQRVFVGGVPTNFQWYAKPGAIGLLKVTGGSFTASNTVYLGANGSGTMLIGSGGVVRCSDLVVSNNPMGKLQFDFGADGSVGQLIVTNRLTIAATAKLEVNVPTAYVAEGRKVFTLATFKTRDGTFADITITNYVPQPYVEQTPTNLLLHIPPRVAGITIMLR
jgi:T5SS/PEP-CTERM-associated repeat protein